MTRSATLHKCRHALIKFVKLYRKRKSRLAAATQNEVASHLKAFQEKILKKDREGANSEYTKLRGLFQTHLYKGFFEKARDFIIGLIIAIAIAFVLRQMWFELYTIPTGSMRPTIKEKDSMVVSKTTFGINLPFSAKHIYFEPDLVKRAGTFTFTGKDLPIPDVDTLYFWIFPGKKQFVKRMMGKPGDTVYFYGGRLYGIDKEGNDITEELELERLARIDHVPYLRMGGNAITPPKPVGGIFSPVVIYQMNEPIARLYIDGQGKIASEMLPPPKGAGVVKQPVTEYGDLWGFKNYANVRILPGNELEIIHSPSLKNAVIGRDQQGRIRPKVGTQSSKIPLTDKGYEALRRTLYTARFIVKDGKAYRYGSKLTPYSPKLKGIPNGTYEFYYGTPHQIKWRGVSTCLSADHPLNNLSRENLITLVNLGIEFDTRFSPQSEYKDILVPSRFAYYRDGDLFVMGGPLYTQESPTLKTFLETEKAFVDHGPPLLEDGSIDRELITHYGLTVPKEHYLALGDNYAMSSDSREFGFVPAGNLRGAPSFTFWPPGSNFGTLNQPPYPFFTFPNITIWILALIAFFLWYRYSKKQTHLPLDIE